MNRPQLQLRPLLDVVIGKRAAILKLLAAENQELLLSRNATALKLGLHVVDGVAGQDILQNDGLATLAAQGLDDDLNETHAGRAARATTRFRRRQIIARENECSPAARLHRHVQTLKLNCDQTLKLRSRQ